MQIRITDFDVWQNPVANDTGLVVLGQFSAVPCGIRLAGCALMWSPRGWSVAPPKVAGENYRIGFEDRALRAGLQSKARAAYYAFGGTFRPPLPPTTSDDEADLRPFMRVDAAVGAASATNFRSPQTPGDYYLTIRLLEGTVF
jgi:hypothetical protein